MPGSREVRVGNALNTRRTTASHPLAVQTPGWFS